MVVAAVPGLRQVVYIAGHNFAQPDKLQPVRAEAETNDRTISGRLLKDAPFLGDTYPTVNDKLTLRVGWGQVAEGDMDHLERIAARFGFFDVCFWNYVQEEFVSTGDVDYKLKRRPATSFLDSEFLPTVSTQYEPVIWVDGADIGGAITVTVGVEDADGFTAVSLSAAPDAGTPFTIRYAPLYRMCRRETMSEPYANVAERREFLFEEQ